MTYKTEMDTLLDLARAYMEMGDSEGAHSILEELAAKGNEEARRMLGLPPAERDESPLFKLQSRGLTLDVTSDKAHRLSADELAEVERRANLGEPDAQAALGKHYSRTLGMSGHVELAIRWFTAAAQQGHLAAMAELGALLRQHHGGDSERIQEGLAWLRRSAEAGHAGAQFSLALALIHPAKRAGETLNLAETIDYLHRAALHGHREAQVGLGRLLLNPANPQADAALAIQWLEQAANAGSIDALRDLAQLYLGSKAASRDLGRAAAYLERAAELGDHRACLDLAKIHQAGIDGTPDLQAAEKWLLQAMGSDEDSESDAKHELCKLYGHAALSAPDKAQKTILLRKGAEIGDADCMYELGEVLLEGDGITTDASEAAQWFRSAAGKGYWMAMDSLGSLYAQGLGVPRDLWSAAFWYREVAWHLEAARRCSEEKDSAKEREALQSARAALPAEAPKCSSEGVAQELGLSLGWRRETGGILMSESGYVLIEYVCIGTKVAPGIFRIDSMPDVPAEIAVGDLVNTATGYGGKPYIVEAIYKK